MPVHTAEAALTLLERYEWLHFDLADYVRSTVHAEALANRWNAYCCQLTNREPPGGAVSTSTLLVTLREQLSYRVGAYEPFLGASSIDELPLIDKAVLSTTTDAFVNTHDFKFFRIKRTSGTTGPRQRIYYSEVFYFDELFLSLRKIAGTMGVCYGQRPVFSTTIVSGTSWPDYLFVDPLNKVGALIRLRINETDISASHELVRRLESINPELIVGNPEILECLLRFVPSERPLRCAPLLIVSSGAILTDDLRQKLEATFRCPVANAYALSEFGLVASECRNHGLHVDTTRVLMEIHVPTDPHGRGSIILSSTANMGMPLIRFCTEDQARLTMAPCNCGIQGPRIEDLIGKTHRCLISTTGRPWRLSRLKQLAEDCGIERYSVIDANSKLLHLEILHEGSVSDRRARRDAFIEKISASCPWPINITVDI